ncbi:MAG: tetratricopeptide repeat protein, partial [Bacteroidia bacterium]
ALKNHFISLKLKEEMGNKQGIAWSYSSISEVFFARKNYREAEEYSLKSVALAGEIEELDDVKQANFDLSEIYTATGRYTEALQRYKLFVAAKDSLVNEVNTKKTVQHQMQYEFDKKEAAAKTEQEKKDAISSAESKKQSIVLILISSMLVLMMVFAAFAYRSFLRKKKANIEISRQKEVIEEKQKEILDSIYYARRIQRALLPNEKYIAKFIK